MGQNKKFRRYSLVFLLAFIVLEGSTYQMKDSHQWRAIVAFNKSEQVSEDWNWFFDDIKKAVAGTDILVIYAGPKDKQVIIGSTANPLVKIDLTPYWAHQKGYLFIMQGREIEYHAYDQSTVILEKAAEYFSISLTH